VCDGKSEASADVLVIDGCDVVDAYVPVGNLVQVASEGKVVGGKILVSLSFNNQWIVCFKESIPIDALPLGEGILGRQLSAEGAEGFFP